MVDNHELPSLLYGVALSTHCEAAVLLRMAAHRQCNRGEDPECYTVVNQFNPPTESGGALCSKACSFCYIRLTTIWPVGLNGAASVSTSRSYSLLLLPDFVSICHRLTSLNQLTVACHVNLFMSCVPGESKK